MEMVLPRKHSVSMALLSAPSDALGILTDSLSSPARQLLLFWCKAETKNSKYRFHCVMLGLVCL